jgi:2'-5' RNA ligase
VRLFVALNLPETVRTSLCTCVRPLQSMGFALRWMTPEQVHLTLKFLGDVEPEREPELVGALCRACTGAGPVTLSLGGFGVFPHYQRPRVVWVGVAPEPALELLQHRMEQEFAPLGFPTEARAFRPHITLGRAGPGARSGGFNELEPALANLRFDAAPLIMTVDLMQSTLQSGGAVYQERHRERLS